MVKYLLQFVSGVLCLVLCDARPRYHLATGYSYSGHTEPIFNWLCISVPQSRFH